jgi:serine/threonine-protein kinase PpkA
MQLSGYHMGNVIGQGGMATVYHAEHILLKQERALKVMSPELTNQPGFSDSFICEGQFIAALQHPNIVSIYDISEQGGMYFMAMEYLHGGSLEDRLPLPLADSIKILQQIGSALHYAHQQQLIHRDIKPANILFNSKGDAILTDFGISKLQDRDSPLTLIGYGVVGTPRYMSPEQRGGEALDKRSDIYSLALVFYEMLSGEKAIKAKITASIVPDLPPEFGFLQNTLNKALAKTADKRYPDVLSFVQDVINEKKKYNRQLIEKEHQRKMRRQLFAFLLILVVIVGSIAVNIDWKANSNQSAINSLPPITDLSAKTEAEKEQIIPAKKVAIDPSKTRAVQY